MMQITSVNIHSHAQGCFWVWHLIYCDDIHSVYFVCVQMLSGATAAQTIHLYSPVIIHGCPHACRINEDRAIRFAVGVSLVSEWRPLTNLITSSPSRRHHSGTVSTGLMQHHQREEKLQTGRWHTHTHTTLMSWQMSFWSSPENYRLKEHKKKIYDYVIR